MITRFSQIAFVLFSVFGSVACWGDPFYSRADDGGVDDSVLADSGTTNPGAVDSSVTDSVVSDSVAVDSRMADSNAVDSFTADSGTADSHPQTVLEKCHNLQSAVCDVLMPCLPTGTSQTDCVGLLEAEGMACGNVVVITAMYDVCIKALRSTKVDCANLGDWLPDSCQQVMLR